MCELADFDLRIVCKQNSRTRVNSWHIVIRTLQELQPRLLFTQTAKLVDFTVGTNHSFRVRKASFKISGLLAKLMTPTIRVERRMILTLFNQ